MCLYLKSTVLKKQGTRTVYKLYTTIEPRRLENNPNLDNGLWVKQFFQGQEFFLEPKRDIVSNRPSKTLRPYERQAERVHHGIHVFISKIQAINYMNNNSFSKLVLIECDAKNIILLRKEYLV